MSNFPWGEYDRKEILGRGGTGIVYLAESHQTGQDVAIKELRPSASGDEQADARFVREIAILQQFDHPNIVRYLDCGVGDAGVFLVMEYVGGGTLHDLLIKHKKLDWKHLCVMVPGVCRGLEFIHKQDIIHRDLKPGNIFFDAQATPKIGDFGLALDKRRSSLTMDGFTVGSVRYMSPEQVRGKTVTPQSDLYSLGCMMFEALVGRPPFDGTNPADVLDKQVYEDAPEIHHFNVQVPETLETLVADLLAKDPLLRPFTPNDVAETCRSLLEQSD